MKQLNCKILENKRIAQDIYKMRIEAPYFARTAKPGQFFEVKCSEQLEPLLRRPLGLHRERRDGIELLYEVAGKGTQVLSKKRAGGVLDVIGPLGNGFDLQLSAFSRRLSAILVAGGVGAAPLLALAEELVQNKKIEIHVFVGAKTKKHILCESDFKRLGAKIHISTDDGSKGYKGFITGLLNDFLLTTYNLPLTTIYACGPNVMLKEVAKIAKAKKIPCQVSLEERMACGVGVCLGCPVEVRTAYSVQRTAYKMVCKDGPVFNAEEVIW